LGKTCEENQAYKASDKCRFCEAAIPQVNNQNGALANVCDSEECQKLKINCCGKTLACGHACLGCKEEIKCLPCLNEDCVKNTVELTQNEDDFCGICWTSALKAEPCV